MIRKYRHLIFGLFLFCMATQAMAAGAGFVIKKIDVEGLQRVSVGTVLTYLPIAAGDRLKPQDTHEIIDSLYQTGFFDNVQLYRRGNVLVIKVIERPTIGNINITGNRTINTKKIKETLKESGLEKGRVFNHSTLTNIQQTLEAQYFDLGRYNARVTTQVKPQTRGRVDVNIDISEGKVAQIRQVKIIGNHAFKEKELLPQIHLKPPSIWSLTFLTQADLYNKEKLDAGLESLKSYYLDRGYLEFKIASTQVSVSPDRKSVYITIRVQEGNKYTFSGFKLSGHLILPRADLEKAVSIKPGDVFSRKAIIQADNKMGIMLGNKGYAFARIAPDPKVDEKKRTVFVNFNITPGQRVYVRRISFTGNVKTADYALRQVLRQFEASVFSLGNIQESERQLKKSGYVKSVDVKTPLVPGTNDEVDLDFNVKENPSATAYVSVGYGTDGFQFGLGLSQQNFLGTGDYLNMNYNQTEYSKNANISFNNPYFKPNGAQLGYSLYYSTFEPTDLDLANYSSETYGGQVTYSIPVSNKDDFIHFGLGAEHQTIAEEDDPPTEVVDFINENGSSFNEGVFSIGWSRNGYDQPIFPTQGLNQSVFGKFYAPLDTNSLTYYTLSYSAHYFRPVTPFFIFNARGQIGYGNGVGSTSELPFYKNFFAGGIDTVRGYQTDTLGPRDSNGNPIGGNVLTDGSLGLILMPLSSDSFRTSLFVDGGNVFEDKIDTSQLRYSAGIEEDWRSPIGPIQFSLAAPLNSRSGDQLEYFQFLVGATF